VTMPRGFAIDREQQSIIGGPAPAMTSRPGPRRPGPMHQQDCQTGAGQMPRPDAPAACPYVFRILIPRLGVSPPANRRSPAFKLSMPVHARILDIYWTLADIKNISN